MIVRMKPLRNTTSPRRNMTMVDCRGCGRKRLKHSGISQHCSKSKDPRCRTYLAQLRSAVSVNNVTNVAKKRRLGSKSGETNSYIIFETCNAYNPQAAMRETRSVTRTRPKTIPVPKMKTMPKTMPAATQPPSSLAITAWTMTAMGRT
jgi:hypothetical protein